MNPNDILSFWFEENGPLQWFQKSLAFDEEIRTRFLDTYEYVVAGGATDWRTSPEGMLAEIVVLDQFSRNMFRGLGKAFAQDTQALILSREAIRVGADVRVSTTKRQFFYMPYMHSEDPATHTEAVQLFTILGNESALRYEKEHQHIIDRFGRFPHRNRILGRISTQEEIEFLKTNPGF